MPWSEMLISRFGTKLVYNKEIADTILNLKLNKVSMNVLQYDAQGYEKLYQALVNIKSIMFQMNIKEVLL